ncbi:MAG: NAD+ synthase [Alphaproteobacteria bacterium]|nr:NAD+ synthase [Alphaproteobacteria bacterium]
MSLKICTSKRHLMDFPLSFTLAQLNPTAGDLRRNTDKIKQVWEAHPDTDLIIFSEMVLSGYPADDLVLKPYFMDEVEKHVQELIQFSKSQESAILLPTPWRNNGALYNAAHLIHGGATLHTSYKHHLPNYGVFDEKRIFTSGGNASVAEFKDIKIGIMICEDMWFPDVAGELKAQGAEILIVPNGSPYQQDIHSTRQTMAKARIDETGLPLIYVNQVGGQDELVFDGRSFVMNEKGEVTYQMPAFKEKTETLSDTNTAIAAFDKGETIYNALTLGIHDYVVKNSFPGVLIGLSGGIDSALAATLAVDVLGSDKVHCVMMPSPYTSKESLEDAKALAKNLDVRYDIIPIENIMGAYDATLKEHIKKETNGVTFENIQSRARAIILMALSNSSGKMVLTTGNKSEMAVGYATLYGDMCGGFNALKDVYKTQVYELCEWRNKQSPIIPERIITKAPSAELKPDQTDQDTLPPYEILDDILHHLVEEETAPEDIPHDKSLVHKVWRMLDISEYKRFQSPPGTKITKQAFGRNRRYPLTNGFFKSVQDQRD